MPTVSISDDSRPLSTTVLPPGTYHATALALSESARVTPSIKVGISHAELLKAENNSVLWTDSLQSCFPVVFKFKNGDIGLYHGNHAAIDNLSDFLDRSDLAEIQLFEKGIDINSAKVRGFTQNLISYFHKKDNVPAMNILTQADIAPYGAVICYKSPDGKPIILVGESGPHNGMSNDIAGCINKDDRVRACVFEPAAQKYPPASKKQHNFKETVQALREEGQEESDVSQKSCCIIS